MPVENPPPPLASRQSVQVWVYGRALELKAGIEKCYLQEFTLGSKTYEYETEKPDEG